MPLYKLTPQKTDDPRWDNSTHDGACRVRAADEEQARHSAAVALSQAAESPSPWTDPELVSCAELADPVAKADRAPDGVVFIPKEDKA